MIEIDSLVQSKTCIDGKWVVARPVKDSRILVRIKDAVLVALGKADAVRYYRQ